MTSDQTQGQTETNDDHTNFQTRELPLSESSVVEDSKVIPEIKEEARLPEELPLSESSVVEEPNVNAQASNQKQLPLSESSVVEEKGPASSIKNVGFVRSKWTEILIEDNDETPDRYDIKKEIFEMMRRREQQACNDPRDDLIRVNRKTYAPVEVNKDRNGRTLYAPILPNGKLKISFTVETRSPCGSEG